jgi:hypothetical protein
MYSFSNNSFLIDSNDAISLKVIKSSIETWYDSVRENNFGFVSVFERENFTSEDLTVKNSVNYI